MKRAVDPLYNIFEQYLFNALVEDESTEEFVEQVVGEYMTRLSAQGTVMTKEHRPAIEADLKAEVLEMYRKKTYGHFNLRQFRKEKGIEVPPIVPETTKARRSRRAC